MACAHLFRVHQASQKTGARGCEDPTDGYMVSTVLLVVVSSMVELHHLILSVLISHHITLTLPLFFLKINCLMFLSTMVQPRWHGMQHHDVA